MNTPTKTFGALSVAFLLLMGANRSAAITIYAVDTSSPQNLLRFDSATPGTIQDSRPITGLQPNETILGIDYRTTNTALYALGSTSRLYTINRFNGGATPVGAPGPFAVNSTIIGFDFDPVSTDFRVVTHTDKNIRLDSDGTVAATETNLFYADGDPNEGVDPNITGAAYTTNVFAARITTLYAIDAQLNILVTQDPPETGELKTKGPLGVDAGFLAGFDIASASGNNTGYATLRVSGTTGLYTINLTTGAATLIGAVGGNPVLVDMTVSLESHNFVVNNTSHLAFGDCSVSSCNLRQAIQAANAKPGPDFISFNIPGGGVHTFNVFSGGLPAITDPVSIDGYTQPGASPNTLAVGNNAVPLIALNGASAGNVPGGLIIRSSRCTVRGLILNRFTNAGIILQELAAPAATATLSNEILGNFIGTDASGTLARGNGTGVMVSAGSTDIGGITPGTRNLISGNSGSGIALDPLANVTEIYGNYIGTDKNGTVALGNGTSGVSIQSEANRIGSTEAGAGNLISGNGQSGIDIKGAEGVNNRVEGNLIGTNATGNAALGNESAGVLINHASHNTVGGPTSAARNVISSNGHNGVYIFNGEDNSVLGNYIGTDAAGQADLGNALSGVIIFEASANFIGGPASGEGNLISGNDTGVYLVGSATTGNRVQGNRIGTDAAGGPLGNIFGIFIAGASGTTVGGTAAAGNTIAFNSMSGVGLGNGNGHGNDITGNSIFSNSGLGIDLVGGTEDGFGVTANDSLDADTGDNRLQNYPVLTGITSTGSTRTVQGVLNSAPNTHYTIDFYRNNAVDPSGFGEGQTPIGVLFVQTDPQGHTSFNFPLDSSANGQFITATATDPFGNTSEFSQASSVVPGPPPPTPTPTATPTPVPARLANISTRLRVETADNVLIGGFIVTGTQPKKIIVRAIGPSLPFPDRLGDPTLELHGPSGLIEANDNWVQSPNQQAIIATTIPPSNDRESAIVATVPANNSAYTAIVRGVNDGTGLGIVEAYDLDSTVDSKLANISTRGLVQTGDNILIAGTIIVGQAAQKVIVRALGPSLSISGKLNDPTLELRDQNGDLLASNDNWRSTQEAEIIATTIPPPNDFESAIVTTLPANGASYTAIMRGVNNTTGIAVVEVYALQ